MGPRVWRWSRRRWRPAWAADSTLLCLESRGRVQHGVRIRPDGPFRVAGSAPAAPLDQLSAFVYAGEIRGAHRGLIRRIEIDPHDGRGWLLWQHVLPAGVALAARLHGRIDKLVLVPRPRGGILALDLYSGAPCWEVGHGAPIDEMMRLPSGRLRAWFKGGEWLEIDVADGQVVDSGRSGKSVRAHLALGGERLLDVGMAASASLVVDGRTLRFGDGFDVPGWQVLGESTQLRTGAERGLALVFRETPKGVTVAGAAIDAGRPGPVELIVLGHFRERPALQSFRLLDGLPVVRLVGSGAEEGVHSVLHPEGQVLACLRGGTVETYDAGRLAWRGVL